MEIKFFIAGLDTEANRVASAKTTQITHNDYSDVFTGIGCFKASFLLQIKDDVKQYQITPRHVAYTLQKLFRNELERLQRVLLCIHQYSIIII